MLHDMDAGMAIVNVISDAARDGIITCIRNFKNIAEALIILFPMDVKQNYMDEALIKDGDGREIRQLIAPVNYPIPSR